MSVSAGSAAGDARSGQLGSGDRGASPEPILGPEAWLVALDIDGTTIHEDGTLDLAVIDAVHRVRERGHEVTLATGRSWNTTEPILHALGITPEYVVCANGAVTMRRMGDVFEGEGEPDYVRAHVETFDPSEVLLQISTNLPGGRFMVELPDTTRLYTEGMVDWDLANAHEVPFGDLLGQEATRVVVVSPDHEIEDFLAIVEGMGLHRVSYAVGWTSWLDIAPHGVNKATALERVRSWLGGAPERTLVIGDGRNDIDMFEWASRGGRAVAMGQAADEVKAAANELTVPVDQAGLVPVLDSLP